MYHCCSALLCSRSRSPQYILQCAQALYREETLIRFSSRYAMRVVPHRVHMGLRDVRCFGLCSDAIPDLFPRRMRSARLSRSIPKDLAVVCIWDLLKRDKSVPVSVSQFHTREELWRLTLAVSCRAMYRTRLPHCALGTDASRGLRPLRIPRSIREAPGFCCAMLRLHWLSK